MQAIQPKTEMTTKPNWTACRAGRTSLLPIKRRWQPNTGCQKPFDRRRTSATCRVTENPFLAEAEAKESQQRGLGTEPLQQLVIGSSPSRLRGPTRAMTSRRSGSNNDHKRNQNNRRCSKTEMSKAPGGPITAPCEVPVTSKPRERQTGTTTTANRHAHAEEENKLEAQSIRSKS